MVDAVRNTVDWWTRMIRRSGTLRVLSTIRRFRRETAAASIVEFAILVPLVVFLFLGIIDFALAFNQRLNIVSVTRDLTRYLAVQATPCNAATQTAIRLRADTIFSKVRSTDPPLSSYITIQPTVANGACSPPHNRVSVTVSSYPMQSLFLRIGPFPLSARAQMVWERGL